MTKHKLIVIEGIDGSGKATQSALLRDYVADLGHKVRLVTFPRYDSRSSELVKMYLAGEIGGSDVSSVNAYAASSFYAADRYISYKNDWGRDYNEGIVIADRYSTSNLIHQMVKLNDENWPDFIKWLEDFEYVKLDLPKPDLVLYLDIPVEMALKLMDNRYSGDQMRKDIHELNRSYLTECRRAGLYLSNLLGWNKIDCTNCGLMRNIEEISKDIQKLAAKL